MKAHSCTVNPSKHLPCSIEKPQQESLKKAFHMLSSMDPRERGPCQRIEDSSYRLRAEPQSAKPQALFVPPHLS